LLGWALLVRAFHLHGIPAVLKNALDHVYAEFNRKPATFVGYGNAGGARAIEQLRLMLVELQVAPLRGAVHLSREQFIGILLDGKAFADFAPLGQAGEAMLRELIWWAEALRAGPRPLCAYVAARNRGSVRILQKCGFRQIGGIQLGFDGVEEYLFQLDR